MTAELTQVEDLEADFAAAEQALDICRQELDDARRELDMQGAPPGGSLPSRVRSLAKDLRSRIGPRRQRMPDERETDTFHFTLRDGGAEVDGYITHGPRGGPCGEVFLRMGKDVDPTFASLLHNFATLVSIALQYGVPLDVIVDKFAGQSYSPAGLTNHPSIRYARSVVDLVMRFLRVKYLPELAAAAAVGDWPRSAADEGG